MAQTPPSAGRPGRQLIVLGIVSVIMFALVFFNGTGGMSWTERAQPRLGMDLVGGTRVTLLATTEDGSPPAADQLELARQIIEGRVNSLGVEEAEVVAEGEDRIVVSVAGEPENALRTVGDPAELRFRKVIERGGGTAPPETPPTPTPTAAPTATSTATPTPSATPSESPAPSPTPNPSPEPTETPEPTQSAEPDTRSPAERQQAVEEKIDAETMQAALAYIEAAAAGGTGDVESIRLFQELTGPEVAVLPAKLQFYLPTITCEQLNARPAGSVQDPDEMVAACDEVEVQTEDGQTEVVRTKYLLDVAKVIGPDIADASAYVPAGTTQWEVGLDFTGDGQPNWTDLTREATEGNTTATPFDPTQLAMNVVSDEDGWRFDTSQEATDQNNRYAAVEGATASTIQCGQNALGQEGNCLVAAVLDIDVISAPQIQQVLTGNSRITGDFDREEAQLLATRLRFGALPLTFQTQEEQTITATLGVAYLKAGLLAAAIGFGLVLLYVFFYYRLLGVVILGSLIVSSLLTYLALVILGRGIGYTLTLAGIAGFIVAVGIAADSFVIYFERLKDEIRDGRTPRSAVPRAWHRARRTIITANMVTLLAAVVLYVLAAGQVRGFAFALGLATVIDLFIVFTFRHPMMTLLARTKAFLSPQVSGLGRALELDRAQAQAARPKEAEA